ncbi:hypothetical protein PRK78_006729 [Emydomyces testavorans]|uniref:Aminoglycoside phosphotransferase domain-containing protein n=1 Tax=Emydomyces testavorans TaxID=2070801 RepID=A0AAF0DLZ2_9EURO|nr:hypothetical protein PRK78_006729 [Emydomyces testavorans]
MPMLEPQLNVTREFRGIDPPPGVCIPTVTELLSLCTAKHPCHYAMHLAYPPQNPVLWIKYGSSVVWNEVPAQAMAYHELRRLGSPVRAPAVFYACTVNYESYLVMEYIPGKTAAQLLEDTNEPAHKEAIYRQVAFALSELHRIPVPQGSRPAALDGGRIRHSIFDDAEAPRHYQNVDQLEQHLNLFLQITKRKSRVQDLAREPMIFCHSDLWFGNFMIDQDGRVTVIDFANTSILPSSFSKFLLLPSQNRLRSVVSKWVSIPSTDGVDNTAALADASGPMIMGQSSFASIGRRVPGNLNREGETIEYYAQVN